MTDHDEHIDDAERRCPLAIERRELLRCIAVIEAFWALMQVELINRCRWRTRLGNVQRHLRVP